MKIQTLNKIATKGLDLFPRDEYEIASEFKEPDAIILRSFKMHQMELPSSLKAVARAGAGVNNIPIDKCSDQGIVVFNTPGANANSVKELVIAGLLLSSRQIYQGIEWTRSIKDQGAEIPKLVESNKKNFAGPEIRGKRLGIIGLGAIGVMVANAATALGMEVTGYDPFISVDSAWDLSRNVNKAKTMEGLLASSDYLTIHVPLNDKTRGLIDADKIALMKDNVRILNFARGGLVVNEDLIKAMDQGKVAFYVTDFPDESLLAHDKVIPLPHLGASTPEAEENCAVMAAGQLKTFLENGSITNSVNFPQCEMPMNQNGDRIIIANKNIPNMVGQITHILAAADINISDMINKHRDNIAYNIIDVNQGVDDSLVDEIKKIEGVVMARVIHQK